MAQFGYICSKIVFNNGTMYSKLYIYKFFRYKSSPIPCHLGYILKHQLKCIGTVPISTLYRPSPEHRINVLNMNKISDGMGTLHYDKKISKLEEKHP